MARKVSKVENLDVKVAKVENTEVENVEDVAVEVEDVVEDDKAETENEALEKYLLELRVKITEKLAVSKFTNIGFNIKSEGQIIGSIYLNVEIERIDRAMSLIKSVIQDKGGKEDILDIIGKRNIVFNDRAWNEKTKAW